MRILIKGGVWKNTEDEILKAAVMKYGLNQWARISSLLVRKSAKQCKARWYEWLDPAIKKTEWSREEEEKLLHLAKLMPTQWRTIAPIVGRTPAQCLEHYEKLLDAAQEKEQQQDEGGASSELARDDPRRLRPGEIDPNPETKPARPDPVDMDEDEKEMLSEARARLANTKGKKAKRKAREKQLEEARRLAALQKRRELKAAGIHMPLHHRKKGKKASKEMDYNKEIPFHKKVPAGFYDTSEERERERKEKDDKAFINMGLQRLDARADRAAGRRGAGQEQEERARKRDREKQEMKKLKDMPAHIMQINRMNDPDSRLQRRSKLNLPAPQITDRELEDIAKMGYNAAPSMDEDEEEEKGAGVTRTLLSDYSAAGGATPAHHGSGQTPALQNRFTTPRPGTAGGGALREARTPARPNTIMNEARNLIALSTAETPLKGGENTPLLPSDFGGATPRRADVQTPNLLATPLHHSSSGSKASATPRSAKKGGATPYTPTPVRDALHINMEEYEAMGDDPRLEKQRQMALAAQLRMSLKALPEPSKQYNIELPPDIDELEEEEDEEEEGERQPEDATDVLNRKLRKQRELEEMRMRLRSRAVLRELPRPLKVNLDVDDDEDTERLILAAAKEDDEGVGLDADDLRAARAQVHDELLTMLHYDAIHYPLAQQQQNNSKKATELAQRYVHFHEREVNAARRVLEQEQKRLLSSHNLILNDEQEAEQEDSLVTAYLRAREEANLDDAFIFSAEKKGFIPSAKASKKEQLAFLENKFNSLSAAVKREAAKALKLEKRLELYHGGYQQRSQVLWEKELQQGHDQLAQAWLELGCFEALRAQEEKVMPTRVKKLREEVGELVERERELQMRYANLATERENLLNEMRKR
ncbi:CDC5 cell division cycle 5-like protein [Balamuthia mandrillaris]